MKKTVRKPFPSPRKTREPSLGALYAILITAIAFGFCIAWICNKYQIF